MKSLTALLCSRKRRILAAFALILILFAAVCLYRGWVSPLQEGISIGGVEVGGLTPAKARQVLEERLEASLLSQPLTVCLPEETITLTPEDCGLQISLEKALFSARHEAANTEISLLPYLEADKAVIRKKLETYAARYDTVLTQPRWQLEGTAPELSTAVFSPDTPSQTLVLTMGTPELHLDCDAILPEILQTLANAPALWEEGRYSVTPVVFPEAFPMRPNPLVIASACETTPVNDSPDLGAFSLRHGTYGTKVDESLLEEQIAQAAFGETIRVPIEYIPPEILGEEAYYLDVLGAYETRYSENFNRIHNLQLQCEALDGFVLQPGETFSMNGVLGERTLERGYLPAPAYSGNRLVQSPGGGVCQGSTTLYNCVLLADLEVVFRACHGVRVGYVPLGLDAAINWLTTDFQFKNNFHFPIRIQAWLEEGYMKMQILGTDEKDYYIKMETGTGEDEIAYYARSYKCKYDKQTHELISREVETYSTYYKGID